MEQDMTSQIKAPADTHIIVGMSGGVDSSVAALILLEQGYRVSGLFMKNWEEDDTGEYCAAAADLADAEAVCAVLGIPLHSVNFAHEYWERVFSIFLTEYEAGRTPNPDILCNREIKFKEFLLQAETLGADFIATGHYVASQSTGDGIKLLKGMDANKDQSYFLYTLGQHALGKSLFPLGEIDKPEVRRIAARASFVTHDKKDSTGICFIGERRFKDFLGTYLKSNPGSMISSDGTEIGRHDGLMFYTIGQRHGLDIGGPGEAWYVSGKDMDNNLLYVVQGHDHPALMSTRLAANEPHWVSGTRIPAGTECTARVRYRQQDQPCVVTLSSDEGIEVTFRESQRAVTPGQAVVLYQGRECLGGATITSCNAGEESAQTPG